MRVAVPLADLTRHPAQGLDRQYAFGERVEVLDGAGVHFHVRAVRDGQEGWMAAASLTDEDPGPSTHAVYTRSAHAYAEPDLKSPVAGWLPFGARLRVTETHVAAAKAAGGARPPAFARTEGGWLPIVQLRDLTEPERDPGEVALRFVSTPYLWGGNGPLGLDCSGLVQAALIACGVPCPADSTPQCEAFGRAPDADPAELPRGALIFWTGHVAMSLGRGRLIHANAHHMAVAVEKTRDAVGRIAAAGSPVIAVSAPLSPPRG